MSAFSTREEWLGALADHMRPMFERLGHPIPTKIRFTCGWPSKGAGARNKALGQCFSPESSSDNTHEIIVGMSLSDPNRVADVLAHELVHAAVGVEAGHKGPFRTLALAIGLEGKMTSTTGGELFKQSVAPMLKIVGDYHHATLDCSSAKKQTTRMIKCVCHECGYTVRVARKWLAIGGEPICPTHQIKMEQELSN